MGLSKNQVSEVENKDGAPHPAIDENKIALFTIPP